MSVIVGLGFCFCPIPTPSRFEFYMSPRRHCFEFGVDSVDWVAAMFAGAVDIERLTHERGFARSGVLHSGLPSPTCSHWKRCVRGAQTIALPQCRQMPARLSLISWTSVLLAFRGSWHHRFLCEARVWDLCLSVCISACDTICIDTRVHPLSNSLLMRLVFQRLKLAVQSSQRYSRATPKSCS